MPKQAVRFLFARIVQSDSRWANPINNRIPEGDYVKKHGFGHEDWNFNKDLLIDGYIHGYTGRTAQEAEKFNIAFATYKNSQWYLVGFYLDCDLMSEPFTTKEVIAQKKRDLKQLGVEINSKDLDDPEMRPQWRVSPDNAILAKGDILIPKDMYNPKNRRLDNPLRLEANIFNDLYELYVSSGFIDPQKHKRFFPGRKSGVAESKEHKKLKDFIANEPRKVGLFGGISKVEVEYRFPSADEVDVVFTTDTERLGIEVKSIISKDSPDDIKRGIYQCVKYQALLCAEHKDRKQSLKARAVLVVEREISSDLSDLAKRLGVEVFVCPVNK